MVACIGHYSDFWEKIFDSIVAAHGRLSGVFFALILTSDVGITVVAYQNDFLLASDYVSIIVYTKTIFMLWNYK